MNIRELREQLSETQQDFSQRYNIPVRTLQNWENGVRTPPIYIYNLLAKQVKIDSLNRKTISLPVYSTNKKKLPSIENYSSTISWLKDIRDYLGDGVVFALDEALMCEESYLGRTDQWIVWVYGDDSLLEYNGVAVLGNTIAPQYVNTNKHGLNYTCFNRTLIDAMSNEKILDPQGITEALSYYYETHNQSFDNLFIPPEFQEQFEKLSQDAKEYYCY